VFEERRINRKVPLPDGFLRWEDKRKVEGELRGR